METVTKQENKRTSKEGVFIDVVGAGYTLLYLNIKIDRIIKFDKIYKEGTNIEEVDTNRR